MLEAIFARQSVAIVGASLDPRKLGYRVIRHVVENGYAGRVFPFHPSTTAIPDQPAFFSIRAAPKPIDLAVIDEYLITQYHCTRAISAACRWAWPIWRRDSCELIEYCA